MWYAKPDQGVFKADGYKCVFALGPAEGRPIKIGASAQPKQRVWAVATNYWRPLIIHEVVWALDLMAKPIADESVRLLDETGLALSPSWYDITAEEALETFHRAAGNLGMRTWTHAQFVAMRADHRRATIDRELAALGA